MASVVNNPPANVGDSKDVRVQFLGQKDPLATHSSILAWEIPMDRGDWRATVHRVAKDSGII